MQGMPMIQAIDRTRNYHLWLRRRTVIGCLWARFALSSTDLLQLAFQVASMHPHLRTCTPVNKRWDARHGPAVTAVAQCE